MSSSVRVAVDVGNSSIKAAAKPVSTFAPEDTELEIRRFPLSDDSWLTEFKRFIEFASGGEPIDWMLASVNDPACTVLTQWLQQQRQEDCLHKIKREDLGLDVNVRFPERVGIDRLLAAVAANRIVSDRPAITIDAGTTITVDVVDAKRVFHGGAIIPGIGLQFRMLHSATDKLPDIPVPPEFTNLETPGRDTEAAMKLGVINGVICGINHLVDLYRQSYEDASVFLTGGDSLALSKVLQRDHQVVTDLPLRGLYGLETHK